MPLRFSIIIIILIRFPFFIICNNCFIARSSKPWSKRTGIKWAQPSRCWKVALARSLSFSNAQTLHITQRDPIAVDSLLSLLKLLCPPPRTFRSQSLPQRTTTGTSPASWRSCASWASIPTSSTWLEPVRTEVSEWHPMAIVDIDARLTWRLCCVINCLARGGVGRKCKAVKNFTRHLEGTGWIFFLQATTNKAGESTWRKTCRYTSCTVAGTVLDTWSKWLKKNGHDNLYEGILHRLKRRADLILWHHLVHSCAPSIQYILICFSLRHFRADFVKHSFQILIRILLTVPLNTALQRTCQILPAADPNRHSHRDPLWSAPGKNPTVSNPNSAGLPEAFFTIAFVGFVRARCCVIYLCICVRFPLATVLAAEYQFPTATCDGFCSLRLNSLCLIRAW